MHTLLFRAFVSSTLHLERDAGRRCRALRWRRPLLCVHLNVRPVPRGEPRQLIATGPAGDRRALECARRQRSPGGHASIGRPSLNALAPPRDLDAAYDGGVGASVGFQAGLNGEGSMRPRLLAEHGVEGKVGRAVSELADR